jgi:hypothetical protein
LKLINSELLIFEDQIVTDIDKKNYLYESLIADHQKNKSIIKNYRKTFFNFKINSTDIFFINLYDKFLEKCKKLFGEFELDLDNKKYCWAYLSNYYERSGYNAIHNHELTSVINGVYYLNVPDIKSGQISFFDNCRKEIFKYSPRENTILIFPYWLNHCANISYSSQYRISINMEIITKKDVWNIFNKQQL